jgi:long-chain fatty acid transport protein
MNLSTFTYRSLALAAVALLPATVNAGALYFQEMSSASESGYAGAGMTARANDPGTAFSNPAGMTRFKQAEMMAGAVGVFIPAGFSSDDSLTTVSGETSGVNKRIVPAGSFAYVRPVSDKFSVGLSAHNYFGLALDWKDDWVGRYSSVNVTLVAPQLQPSVAYKVSDWLSVGAGAAVTMGYMKDKMRVRALTPGGKDGLLRISDTDFAMQYNFGIMLQPWDHTRIGLRYLTQTDLDFADDPDLSWRDPIGQSVGQPNTELDLKVRMPQTVHAGIHHQWNDDLALLASVGWEEFSEFGRVQVEVDSVTGDVNTRLDADFRDVWHFGVGTEYKYNAKLDLTAGFTYGSSMSSSRTRPIVIPLGNMYRWAVGFKQKRREDLTIGGGLSFVWEGNLPIEDSGGVSGKYKDVSIIIGSVYARWH